jgi:Protein of unknown function (DUF3467)
LPNGEEEGISVGIGPPKLPDYLRPIYANHVLVNHTPWDFRLLFSVLKFPIPGEEEAVKERGHMEPEAVAEVLIPANLMVGLITAMKQNFDRYAAQFGIPGMDLSGPGTEVS